MPLEWTGPHTATATPPQTYCLPLRGSVSITVIAIKNKWPLCQQSIYHWIFLSVEALPMSWHSTSFKLHKYIRQPYTGKVSGSKLNTMLVAGKPWLRY